MSLCLVFSAYDNYLYQVNNVKIDAMQHKLNENMLVLLQSGKKGFNVGKMIALRRSTLTGIMGAVANYFVIMIQLFLIDPHKRIKIDS